MRTHQYDSDEDEDGGDPIDTLVRFCEAHGWPCENVNEDEVITTVQGSWSNYELRGVWREEDGVLQLLMFPEIKVVEDKRSVVYEALSLINEQLWMGHFELWSAGGIIVWRHATLLGRDAELSLEMTESLVQTAVDECERFYPVFQFILWGGKTPSEAISAALIETRGEA